MKDKGIFVLRYLRGWTSENIDSGFWAIGRQSGERRDKPACCSLATMRNMMNKVKLTVNDTKTRVCRLPEEKFDFLGYTFGRCYSTKTGRAYLGTVPSKNRVKRICAAISNETGRNTLVLDVEAVVGKLNQMLRGLDVMEVPRSACSVSWPG